MIVSTSLLTRTIMIVVALTAMGGATVAASVSTAAIAVMFGTAGAGLASYKMDQRTIGIKEFFIESYTSKNQVKKDIRRELLSI
jgi:Rieske Fe-S protein